MIGVKFDLKLSPYTTENKLIMTDGDLDIQRYERLKNVVNGKPYSMQTQILITHSHKACAHGSRESHFVRLPIPD